MLNVALTPHHSEHTGEMYFFGELKGARSLIQRETFLMFVHSSLYFHLKSFRLSLSFLKVSFEN
jgi:hypothetical protein